MRCSRTHQPTDTEENPVNQHQRIINAPPALRSFAYNFELGHWRYTPRRRTLVIALHEEPRWQVRAQCQREALERAERERVARESERLARMREEARRFFEAMRERNRLREWTTGIRRGPRAFR